MDDLLFQIVLASLLHDIGKIYERANISIPEDFRKNNQDLYQPSSKGSYTHAHVLSTAFFIEKFMNNMPDIAKYYTSYEDSLINLASAHHKPFSPLHLIIHEADCLSSGHERKVLDESKTLEKGKEVRNIPMFSIFEDIDLSEAWNLPKDNLFKFAHNIDLLGPDTLFPRKREECAVGKESYEKIIDYFEKSFKALPSRDNPYQWLANLDSLLMRCFSYVPSALVDYKDGKFIEIWADVSLYDHLFLTSSFASALYRYHKDTETLDEEKIKNRSLEKFLLIEGNFYGIQNFIFSSGGSTSKYAAKLLRGRSFMVSLLSELVSLFILERLGLIFNSVLYNTAGKFLILAPNLENVRRTLAEVENEINEWLYERFYGETSIGLITQTAKPSDFLTTEGYSSLLRSLGRQSEEKKYRKFNLVTFGGYPKDYFENFAGARPCDLCGKRPASTTLLDENITACVICRDQVELGKQLVHKKFLVVTKPSKKDTTLKETYLNRFKISLLQYPEVWPKEDCVVVWDLNPSFPARTDQVSKGDQKSEAHHDHGSLYAFKLINSYVPRNSEGDIYTFEHLSQMSIETVNGEKFGIEALGVVKADVDNLSEIFYKGIRPEKRTFARYLTISRQLNLFFAYYLPYKCLIDRKNIYNVFSGGDDLFVIGPWKEALEYIREVIKLFKEFVCHNDYITISAGYLLTKPVLPVSTMAKKCEDYLNQAKRSGKNRIHIFGVTSTWNTLEELGELEKALLEMFDNEYFGKSYLYRLNELVEMVSQSIQIIEDFKRGINTGAKLDNLRSFLWPSKLYYFTVRNISKGKFSNSDERNEFIEKILIDLRTAFEKYGANLRIPIWKVIYQRRRAKYE
ncbi:MAG: type III-A CRISPR-associated protein Cas10/Csm1 [Candidatus Kryptonium sp.]